MKTTLIAKNIKRIRLDLGFTQVEIAKKSRISKLTYSNVELGKTSPRMDTLYKIAFGMGVGIQDFLKQVRELQVVRFRAHKKLKRRDQILAKTANWLDDFNFLLKVVKSKSEYTLSELPKKLGKISPIEMARNARKEMGLDLKEPIHDIAGLFDSNGIKILSYILKSDSFFGMSIGASEGGPAIVVNTWDRIPVERWIFSAAHELGHLLLHLHAYDVDCLEEDKEQEDEANAFASEFLMPQKGFEKEWQETRGLVLLDRILKVKRIYHVSYKTILYRLIEMGVCDNNIWRDTNISLRNRYRQKITKVFEPEKLHEYDFIADWLPRLVRLAYEKKSISKNRASEILDISLDEMRQRVNSWAEDRSVGQSI